MFWSSWHSQRIFAGLILGSAAVTAIVAVVLFNTNSQNEQNPASHVAAQVADPGCDWLCQAAEQRQKDDLTAQQTMADAAKRLTELTHWEIFVGFLALAGLGVTIHYTRKTANAAVTASHAAKASAEAQISADRPLVQIANLQFVKPPGPTDEARATIGKAPTREIRFEFQNFGKVVCLLRGYGIFNHFGTELPKPTDTDPGEGYFGLIPPGEKFENSDAALRQKFTVEIPPELVEALQAGREVSPSERRPKAEVAYLWIYGFARYSGLGGRIWTSRFAYRMVLTSDLNSKQKDNAGDDRYWRETFDD